MMLKLYDLGYFRSLKLRRRGGLLVPSRPPYDLETVIAFNTIWDMVILPSISQCFCVNIFKNCKIYKFIEISKYIVMQFQLVFLKLLSE